VRPSCFWSFLWMLPYDWATNTVLTIYWFSGTSGSKGMYTWKASQSPS
jgi:hypothetical protein